MQQTPPDSSPREQQISHRSSSDAAVEDRRFIAKKPKNVDAADPHPSKPQDRLSAAPLQKETLRALNQENKKAARDFKSSQRIQCPTARRAQKEWKRHYRLIEPHDRYLEKCGHEQRKALKSFARYGGPDLRDLRGCQRAAVHTKKRTRSSQPSSSRRMSPSLQSSKSKITTDTGTNKSLSPYNRPFQQLLVDSQIFPPYYQHPDGTAASEPENLDYIKERLTRRRPSLSPSQFTRTEHIAFIRKDADAANEEQVRTNVIPVIQGTIKNSQTVSGEVLFLNLTPFTTDEKVTSGKPDVYHGARPEQLKRPIRKELSHLIIPSTQEDLPILPSHFTAIKGPDGNAAIAKRQATYDAYLGARGIHALQNYGLAEPSFDNKAYTFAFIYHSPTLSAFVCHPVQSADPGEPSCYYMTAVGSFAMLHNLETWAEGATWYRNSIDLAKEWRDEFISAANNILRAPKASVVPNASTNLASIGDHLRALTMEFQANNAASGGDEDCGTAESSEGRRRRREKKLVHL